MRAYAYGNVFLPWYFICIEFFSVIISFDHARLLVYAYQSCWNSIGTKRLVIHTT